MSSFLYTSDAADEQRCADPGRCRRMCIDYVIRYRGFQYAENNRLTGRIADFREISKLTITN